MLDYRGKLVLAPMVRVSELPLRALSLKYGADLVWGPEIVDKRMLASRRVVNTDLQTVDFVSVADPSKLTWRTDPALEKSRVVFQLGTSDPALAVAAAKMVANDVAAIDLNCGCPKHFSVHSGMGAQLLTMPDRLLSILRSLISEVGKPHGIAISVKIRILESMDKTLALVREIVKTGVAALTVHCRTTPMRPREPAIYDQLAAISAVCREAGVPCLVNGDIESRADLQPFCEKFNVDGAMIARAAQANPSCFRGPDLEPPLVICREFLDACIKYDYNTSHAKYNLTNLVSGRDPLYQKFARSKSKEEMDMHLRAAEEAHATEEQPGARDKHAASNDQVRPDSSSLGATTSGDTPSSNIGAFRKRRDSESAAHVPKRVHVA